MPSVSLHKSGRFVRLQPNDIFAADVVREVTERKKVVSMRLPSYYNVPTKDATGIIPENESKIEIWQWLEKGLEEHPIVKILASYGVTTTVEESLKNYMVKEAKRQVVDNTPYPSTIIDSDVPLFDRCCEGTVLHCTKNFGKTPTFEKGARYMVLSAGDDGSEHITISTNKLASGASFNLSGNAAKYKWTVFEEPLEEYFTDTDTTEVEKDISKKYKDRLKQAKKRLESMQLPLYDHVKEDAAMMSLKRNVLNAYLMRMGKTSCGIAVAELSNSRKIGIISPGNARIFWAKEFERLGFKEGKDFKEVKELSDFDPNIKYHLMTYNWLSYTKDKTYKDRKNWEHILKPSLRTIKRKRANVSYAEIEEVEVELFNTCPHCEAKMERLLRDGKGGLVVSANGKVTWTTKRGYICRNKSCKWKEDNRDIKADWSQKKLVNHVGGYIDYELAKHADCEDVRVKGRMCPECQVADGVWTPPRYKRLKKKYTHVILDESHATKDPSTNTSTAALNMRARRKQALTGTPMSNSAQDLYYPLHWLCSAPSTGFPYFLQSGYKAYDNRFCDAVFVEKPVGTETSEDGKVTKITKSVRKRVPFLKNPPDFWSFVAPKIVRRSYADPLFVQTLTDNGKFMPNTDIRKINCPMDPVQSALMLASIKDFKKTFEKISKTAKSSGNQLNPTLIIAQMSTMRTAATCPEYLNTKLGRKIYTGPAGGGKLEYIKAIINDKVQAGGKVVILSDFVQMHSTVSKATNHKQIVFNTGWNEEQRKEAFDQFQLDPETKLFIAGTRAIREGVDLSSADTVICCDLLWSPAFQTQAWSRIMAPTSIERTCEVYIMLSANSLDQHIFNVFYSKMIAAEQAIDRKVLSRKAQHIDIQWFVDRVLDEEAALAQCIRDYGEDISKISRLDLSQFEARNDA